MEQQCVQAGSGQHASVLGDRGAFGRRAVTVAGGHHGEQNAAPQHLPHVFPKSHDGPDRIGHPGLAGPV